MPTLYHFLPNLTWGNILLSIIVIIFCHRIINNIPRKQPLYQSRNSKEDRNCCYVNNNFILIINKLNNIIIYYYYVLLLLYNKKASLLDPMGAVYFYCSPKRAWRLSNVFCRGEMSNDWRLLQRFVPTSHHRSTFYISLQISSPCKPAFIVLNHVLL